MTIFLCPHFESLSEFVPSSTGEVSHGDCGWDAVLMAAHPFDPARYPLTGDGLAAVRDDAIAHGYADPNGAVNIPNLDRYLTDRGFPHRTVGYAQFDLNTFHTLIESYVQPGGLRAPVIVETSAAGKGLVEDEANVLYHFFTLAGEDTTTLDGDGEHGGYLRGDGDAVKYNAWPAAKYPLATSWDALVKCGPIAYIIIDGVPAAQSQPAASGGATTAGEVKMPAIPSGWQDSASGDPTNSSGVLTAPNGHKLVQGIRAFVLTYPAPGGWPADNLPLEDEHPQHVMELANPAIPDGAQQAFRRSVIEWIPSDTPGGKGPKAGCFEMWVGQELLATRKALHGAQASLADQQAMNQTITQHAADLSNQLAQASLTIKQLQAQIAAASAPLTPKQQLEIQIGEAILALAKMG